MYVCYFNISKKTPQVICLACNLSEEVDFKTKENNEN